MRSLIRDGAEENRDNSWRLEGKEKNQVAIRSAFSVRVRCFGENPTRKKKKKQQRKPVISSAVMKSSSSLMYEPLDRLCLVDIVCTQPTPRELSSTSANVRRLLSNEKEKKAE